MEPTQELVDAIYRDKVNAARRMSFADKFLAGAELFDFACNVSRSGIRMQNPHFNDEQVEIELRRRLDIGRRNESQQW